MADRGTTGHFSASRAAYGVSGLLVGWLLCAMIVFSPWAFGTTQSWSVSIMNIAGWVLGLLFLVRRLLARRADAAQRHGTFSSIPVTAVAILTVLLLAYALASAANAAATYLPTEWRLEEHRHIAWLPHSFDAPASWQAWWSYLALACVFWAAWDWLSEVRHSSVNVAVPRVSSRLRRILWVLTVNGALLAIEAIVQRTSGTSKLLWFMPTHDNKEAASQFGPYAYRANAAQYLNLVWPAALGLWWWLHHDRSQTVTRRGLHHVLLPCVMVIAAAALFSLSRAGAAVAALLLLGSAVVFATRRGAPPLQRWGGVAILALTIAAGAFISWNTLGERFASTADDPLIGRRETYDLARQMARDYPWFGTGPGTFPSLFQIYRQNPEQYWPGQLHNDWLELRITFGRVGFGMILAALAAAAMRWLGTGGVPRDTTFIGLVVLALGGCLLHARVDFPFQIYSIEFLFVLLCAVLCSSSRFAPSRDGC